MVLYWSLAGGSNLEVFAGDLVTKGSTGIHFWTASLKASTQNTGYGDSRMLGRGPWSVSCENSTSKSKYYQPVRTEGFDVFDEVNCGCPSLLILGGGVDVASDVDLSSASWSSDETMIVCDSGFLDAVVAPEKDNGCREQTSLASTAADRSKVQKSCAPKSRDPCIVWACFLKSSRDNITSALDSIVS